MEVPSELLPKLHSILDKKYHSTPPEIREYMLSLDQCKDIKNNPDLIQYKNRVLELGSGWGEFTRENGSREPGTLFIAVEKKKYRVIRSVREQRSMGIHNIRWLIHNIDWGFYGLFPEGYFSKVVINFPDPWPKKRSHKHRFIGIDLLDEVWRVLLPGGILEIGTDYWPYMEDIFGSDRERKKLWENCNGEFVVVKKIPGRVTSFFEQLKRDEGENTYFIVLKKLPQ